MNDRGKFVVEVVVALIIIFFFFKEIKSGAFGAASGAGAGAGTGAPAPGAPGASSKGGCGCGCGGGTSTTVPTETFSNPGSYEYLEATGGGQGTKLVVSVNPLPTSNSFIAFNAAAQNSLVPNT